jgi:crotonobetainyl-CoA:carnitine CoA-transferase CaiB-like acyl-CoA transferase
MIWKPDNFSPLIGAVKRRFSSSLRDTEMDTPINRLKALRWASAWVLAVCAGAGATAASAQNAYRCDVNGTAVYSEKPCADGKAVAPTQDTDAQRARSKEAAAHVKADNRAIDSRIEKRANDEAKARAAERRALAKSERAEAAAQKKKAAKAKATKAKMKVAKVRKSKSGSAKPSAGSKPS